MSSLEFERRLAERERADMAPGGDYYPFSADNLQEVIAEADDDFHEALANLAADDDYAGLGAAIRERSKTYWQAQWDEYRRPRHEEAIRNELAREEYDRHVFGSAYAG